MSVLKTGLSVVGLGWYLGLWIIGITGCITARRRYRVRPRSPLASLLKSSAEGVSILRPLKGLDINLYENLESTFLQDYPNFEIILSVAEAEDQAVPIIRELINKYPQVEAKLIIGEEVVGVNPKVNNLVRSYQGAKHDIVWIIDSNITMDRGALARAVDTLTFSSPKTSKRIGLVHHVPYAVASERKLGSLIEEAFLNTNHAKMYLAINTFATESCVVGKSNIYRRSDVDRVDGSMKPIPNAHEGGHQHTRRGFASFGRFLAEDNMIASALWHELDLRHDLSCDVAKNIIGNMSVKDYALRRARWIRVRKHMVLAATILEPITESVALAFIFALSSGYLFGVPHWIAFITHYIPWIWVDLDVYSSLAGQPLPWSQYPMFLTAWALRELLAFPIFCYAIVGSNVQWRGATYRVLKHGEVQELDNSANRTSSHSYELVGQDENCHS
jgi:ceramide glucosyltransferase